MTVAYTMVLGLFAAACIAGFVAGGYGMYYMAKTLGGYHPSRKWGMLVPISIFIPWFFTDDGNTDRVRMLRSVGAFLLCWMIVFAIGVFTNAFNWSMPPNKTLQPTGQG